MRRLALLLAATLAACASGSSMHHAHHGGHPRHANHGNPDDLASYAARLDDPARDAWQKPDEVVRALALPEGGTLCDIGAGSGYFALRGAKAVGAGGRVFAVDVEPRLLAVLREKLAGADLRHVTPVLALPDHPLVPDASCDVVLVVNTYHHFPDGAAYLKQLARALKPGGRLVNIDFHAGELPVGPAADHKISREAFLADAAKAGLRLQGEQTFLPHQYFVVLAP